MIHKKPEIKKSHGTVPWSILSFASPTFFVSEEKAVPKNSLRDVLSMEESGNRKRTNQSAVPMQPMKGLSLHLLSCDVL